MTCAGVLLSPGAIRLLEYRSSFGCYSSLSGWESFSLTRIQGPDVTSRGTCFYMTCEGPMVERHRLFPFPGYGKRSFSRSSCQAIKGSSAAPKSQHHRHQADATFSRFATVASGAKQ